MTTLKKIQIASAVSLVLSSGLVSSNDIDNTSTGIVHILQVNTSQSSISLNQIGTTKEPFTISGNANISIAQGASYAIDGVTITSQKGGSNNIVTGSIAALSPSTIIINQVGSDNTEKVNITNGMKNGTLILTQHDGANGSVTVNSMLGGTLQVDQYNGNITVNSVVVGDGNSLGMVNGYLSIIQRGNGQTVNVISYNDMSLNHTIIDQKETATNSTINLIDGGAVNYGNLTVNQYGANQNTTIRFEHGSSGTLNLNNSGTLYITL